MLTSTSPEVYGYVYLITCKSNGKVYVGQTIATRGIAWRWKQHLAAAKNNSDGILYTAMRSHGIDDFDVQEIGRARDKQSLDNLEAVYIILFNSMNRELGYNRRAGGPTRSFSEESRRKMSESRKGRVLTPEWKAKIAAGVKGKTINGPEARERTRQRMLGNKYGCFKRSEETRAKMGPKTPENIAKVIANLNKGRKVWQEGDPRSEKGQFVKGAKYTKRA